MKTLLWILFVVLTALPVATYVAYYFRRLDTRRKQLLQTLVTLSLHEEYMLLRYNNKYQDWRKHCSDEETLIEKFENDYFNIDFRAGHSHWDFIWPVLWFTLFTAIGWLFTFQRVLPDFGPFPNLTPIPDTLAYGFIGAYLACLLTIFEGFRRYDLSPGLFYSITYRIIFSSFAAYVAIKIVELPLKAVIAFGIGLFPLERTWAFITERAATVLGAGQNEKEVGEDLANIQGLEHSTNRQKLIDVGVTTVQGLATADPLWLFFVTTFPLRTVVDMIDKAILYLYLGKQVEELRKHGINGVIELVALAKLAEKIPAYKSQQDTTSEPLGQLFTKIDTEQLVIDVGKVIGQSPQELKTFIYNMYYDPMVKLIYEIWGRYLNRPVERALMKEQSVITAPVPGNGTQSEVKALS
jgi:hypothetical protein